MIDSNESNERAAMKEGAEKAERTSVDERAEIRERVVGKESADKPERAASAESATSPERAGGLENTEPKERADERESAALRERADLPESAEQPEQPIHKAGYPQINFASHSLWEAQQAGWPDHLPHEAWTEMIRLYNADKPPKGRSDEHPAFREDYAPNYMATPLDPKPEPASKPGTKTRR